MLQSAVIWFNRTLSAEFPDGKPNLAMWLLLIMLSVMGVYYGGAFFGESQSHTLYQREARPEISGVFG